MQSCFTLATQTLSPNMDQCFHQLFKTPYASNPITWKILQRLKWRSIAGPRLRPNTAAKVGPKRAAGRCDIVRWSFLGFTHMCYTKMPENRENSGNCYWNVSHTWIETLKTPKYSTWDNFAPSGGFWTQSIHGCYTKMPDNRVIRVTVNWNVSLPRIETLKTLSYSIWHNCAPSGGFWTQSIHGWYTKMPDNRVIRVTVTETYRTRG